MLTEIECPESSSVGWARYDEAQGTLEVDFKNVAGVKTSTYRYEQFPAEEWNRFTEAERKGLHFAHEIRPKYRGVKV